MVKWTTIILAVLGLAMAIWTTSTSHSEPAKPPTAAPPSVNPFADGIAAGGLVEAAQRNVQVQAPEPGLVVKVHAQVNDRVKKGQELFELDPRILESQAMQARATLAAARAKVDWHKALPRAEDLPPVEASLRQARADYEIAQSDFRKITDLREKKVATEWEWEQSRMRAEAGKAALERAEAQLKLMRAGAWEMDIQLAQAQVTQAQADLAALQSRLDRLVVRAPSDGWVLKRNIEPGEYTNALPSNPALLLGDMSELHVRAQIDEEDIPLLRAGASGVARLRGAAPRAFNLKMIRIEPYAQPKAQISGSATERIDTRVVDVIFRVEDEPQPATAPAVSGSLTLQPGAMGEMALYPGMLVDVYVEARR